MHDTSLLMLQYAFFAAQHKALPRATLRLPPVYHRPARRLMTAAEDLRSVFAVRAFLDSSCRVLSVAC